MVDHGRRPGDDTFVATADGRRLRTVASGAGDDLVVLEAGLGMSGLYWGPVQAAIAPRARVMAYDRAGFGPSTPDARPRGLARLASDLLAVVGAFPHRRLVLVGHSWGGPVVRVAAARLRASGSPPAGVLLVDPSDEHAPDLYLARAIRWSDAVQAALLVPLARLTLLAAFTRPMIADLPKPLRDATLAASTSVTAARAAVAELRHVPDAIQGLIDAPPRLDGISLTVVSGARTTRLDARLRARLVRAHAETVRGHPGARHVLADRSGHMVPTNDPGLVAAEALRLLGAQSSI